jgi:hypothetical protein
MVNLPEYGIDCYFVAIIKRHCMAGLNGELEAGAM